jgi:hypothetical protein
MTDASTGYEASETRAKEGLIRAAVDAREEHVEDEPRGSLVLLLIFLAVMVGVWLYAYFLLLGRQ